MKISWEPPSTAMPLRSARVVCALWVTIATFGPTGALTRVDLPALGAPRTAMNPQRGAAASSMAVELAIPKSLASAPGSENWRRREPASEFPKGLSHFAGSCCSGVTLRGSRTCYSGRGSGIGIGDTMNLRALGAALILSLCGTAAIAADVAVTVAPAPPPVWPRTWAWNGFYGGINAGWSFGNAQNAWKIIAPPSDFLVVGTDSERLTGPLGGIQAGWNWQISMFLAGIEADVDFGHEAGKH